MANPKSEIRNSKSDGPLFREMVVVGVGLIGGSLALAARKAGLVETVVGVEADPAHREMALAAGVADRVTERLSGDLARADLVVLAVPVTGIAALLPEVARFASETCLVTDVGSVKGPILAAGDGESVRALAARMVDRDVRLLVIDNLNVIAGEADENSAEMNGPMSGLRWLAETGAAVVVIHHQRKSNGLATRAGETLRGHGTIEAKLDLALLITREEETVTVTPTKTRGPMIKAFSAKFAFENDPSHELVTARFWPSETAAADADADLPDSELQTLILGELQKFGEMSANQIYERIGGNRNKVLDMIRHMRGGKQLGEKKGNRGGFLLYPLD